MEIFKELGFVLNNFRVAPWVISAFRACSVLLRTLSMVTECPASKQYAWQSTSGGSENQKGQPTVDILCSHTMLEAKVPVNFGNSFLF